MSNDESPTETAGSTPHHEPTDTDTERNAHDEAAAEAGPPRDDRPVAEVLAQVEVLQEENRRLRADYARARRTEYRRAALALVGFSGLAVGGGVAFPAERATLFGLAGIGCVLAILLYYLTPHHVAAATVGERAYATLARLGDAISADLGLQQTHIYVPTPADTGPASAAQLFIPLHTDYTVPAADHLTSVFVVQTTEQTHGIAISPTGALLLDECQHTMIDDLARTPDALGEQLTEAAVAGFELAEAVVADVDAAEGQATIGIRGSTFGAVDRFDHPLASFIATGFAVGLRTAVERVAVSTQTGEFDATVTYTWNPKDAPAGNAAPDDAEGTPQS